MTISKQQLESLKAIFETAEERGKISIMCNPGTRDVVILFTLDETSFDVLCGEMHG